MQLIGLVNRSLPLARQKTSIRRVLQPDTFTSNAYETPTRYYDFMNESCGVYWKWNQLSFFSQNWHLDGATQKKLCNYSSSTTDKGSESCLSYRQLTAWWWWVQQKFGFFSVQLGWGRAFQMVDKLKRVQGEFLTCIHSISLSILPPIYWG